MDPVQLILILISVRVLGFKELLISEKYILELTYFSRKQSNFTFLMLLYYKS